MAISFAQVNTRPSTYVVGDRVQVVTDFTLDGSYPTGGYSLTAGGLNGFNQIDFVDVSCNSVAAAPYLVYNYATQKLQAFSAPATEVTNATSLATVTGRLQILGDGFPSFSART